MSHYTVHSYLRSIKCLASRLVGVGHLASNPFKAVNPYYKARRLWRPSEPRGSLGPDERLAHPDEHDEA